MPDTSGDTNREYPLTRNGLATVLIAVVCIALLVWVTLYCAQRYKKGTKGKNFQNVLLSI